MAVLVVGAGPTGLLVAGDLAAAGVETTVLDKRQNESNLSRAFAVHARTLELLDARGLADELVETGQRLDRLQLLGKINLMLSRLPSRFPYVLISPQYHTERLLERRARSAGADIVSGAEVTGLRQDADGVDVEVRAADGTVSTRRVSYVVGADGVRSTVRHALGLPFPGRSVLRSVMLADVRLTDPPPDVLTVNSSDAGLAFIAPFGDGWYRLIAWNREHQVADSEPVDLEEIRDVTRRVLGTDFGMYDARWMSRFHNDERQVPRYRVGRVFLAGDAAHVHSPAGGQGMNTGLQDSANLGWKLAAAHAGWAGDDLLDSYHAERFPVGKFVLRLSGGLLRMALIRLGPLRTVRGLVAGTAVHIGPIANAAARAVSGIAIHYPAGPGAHPLAGRRAPDLPLAGGQRLYEALRAGRFVLLAAGEPPAIAAEWADRVVTASRAGSRPGLALVRPDGYFAWASQESDPEALRVALERWCGKASPTG
jgi:2-polyprenyl-6-methoxyphenol hydroxylase-like FAD-dependent oxidoreductase